MTSKICATCKHLIGIRSRPEYAEGWGCGHDGNVANKEFDVVTGLEKTTRIEIICYGVRAKETMCGAEGKWWEEYIPYVPPMTPPRPKRVSTSDITADDL